MTVPEGSWLWCGPCRSYHHPHNLSCRVFARVHPREDDQTISPAQIVYGHSSDPRWETTQELPRADVMCAVRLAYQDTSQITHPVLALLEHSDPVRLQPPQEHFGYDPYDSARVARWDRRQALIHRMSRQAHEMFKTVERRRIINTQLRQESMVILVLDSVILGLTVALSYMVTTWVIA